VDRIDVADCDKVRATPGVGVEGETCASAASCDALNLGVPGVEAK